MNVRDLQKTLENQHEQLKLYEKKLKDVVRAYKSLDAEKSALQKALDSLSQQDKDGQSASSTSSEDAVQNLKTAIATLTRENTKKEAAFQNDKKILLNENAALKEQLKKSAEVNSNAEKMIKSLQMKLQQVEVDRERELADHGKVLAEMQARFAKEHQSFEAGAKESAVLSKKINQKDEALSQLKAREADLVRQVAALSKEVKELTEKAYHVPSIQILKDEMANLKTDHARELRDAVTKTKHSTQLEEQEKASQKIAELEAKTMSLLETVARSEEARSEAHEALLQAEEEKTALAEELLELRSRQRNQESEFDDQDAVTTLKLAVAKIRGKNPGFDFHAVIGPDPEKKKLQHELRTLKDEYDQCKHRLDLLTANNAETDHAGDSKEENIRSVAEQFQNKIRKLVAVHAKDRAAYEKSARDLNARISELEQREGRLVTEMRREMNNRISEMEAEMQKQRSRTIDVVAEKERELEAARSILVTLRSEQMNAPADPSQAGKVTVSKRRSSEHKRYVDRRYSTGSRKSLDAISVSSVDAVTDGSGIPIPMANESRNIFYEEELLKKDREIQEMRSVSHQLDYRLREVEQAALVKELEHHKKTEAMSEEITKLQNKLSLLSTGGEMEYLRNIFVQFIQSNNSSAKKNILKAMGMALKLSANEMKSIETLVPPILTIPTQNALDPETSAITDNYIIIDYVNESFFIFSEEDASRLRSELRMVVTSAMSSEDEAPYFIAPEQVTLLVQYGYARVREALPDRPILPPTNSTAEVVTPSEGEEERARLIAVGRKAKALKRSKMGDGCTAKELRVSKNDLVGIEVSPEEILEVVMELRQRKASDEEEKFIRFLKIETDDNLYRWLDDYEIPVPSTREFRARELVYHDLWRKGYYLTSGEQFGSAWLVYEGLPGDVHAKFLCEFVLDDESLSPLNLISLVRVATQVKKNLLVAVVPSDSNLPHYITIDWFKPYTKEFE
ncbi:tRNA intron endonuclease [Ancylostoma caninum]|uniref:tRNA-intron lyase n=1 Tax=Ancylostoma caninum TaxID=29170 RepID=A0A368FI92_ANCCA|nr:tRNA intron endonuclease [Ancylostoma caninum]